MTTTQPESKNDSAAADRLKQMQSIMFNLWNPDDPTGEGWAGIFDPDAIPAQSFYDWIEYHSYDETEGTFNFE